MEENQLKEVKLVLGYDYYIVSYKASSLINYLKTGESNSIGSISIKDYYKEYIEGYMKRRNNEGQKFLSIIYKNYGLEIVLGENFIKKDTKEFFKYIIDTTSYAIISKAKDSGKIYFFKEQQELDEYIKNNDIKNKIFEDCCKIELSDKLLERLR